jgi:hypothetical protein
VVIFLILGSYSLSVLVIGLVADINIAYFLSQNAKVRRAILGYIFEGMFVSLLKIRPFIRLPLSFFFCRVEGNVPGKTLN